MAQIPEEWRLSPSQHLGIFENEIAPREILPHVQHQNTSSDSSTINNSNKRPPLAIIIVGQTGAGKTRLAPDLLKAMNNLSSSSPSNKVKNDNQEGPKPGVGVGVGTAHLIADTYKTYHPFYSTALSSPSTAHLASPLTSSSAREWLKMACTLCTTHRIPVLLESACRHPDDFIQLASIFHGRGYRVLVAILAVPRALSRLGILIRYFGDLPEARSGNLPLRLTPSKVHDESYSGLEEAAGWVDTNSEGAVDGVVVVRRGGWVAFSNRRVLQTGSRREEEGREKDIERGNEVSGKRKWEKQPGAMKALMRERGRALSDEEMVTARRDIEQLRLLHDPKVDGEIRRIKELLEELGREQQVLPELEEVFDASRFVREFYLDH